MLDFPTKPTSADFCWTVFASRYAIGSDKGATVQEVPWEFASGWENYCSSQERFSETVIAKDASPGIVHGDCGGWRGLNDVKSCTALVIDCDRSPLAEYAIDDFLDDLNGVRYFFQWRNGKFHLVLPLADPMTLPPLAPNQVQARRRRAIKFFEDAFERTLDETPATANALLHPYAKRTEDERVITRFKDGPSLDLARLLGRLGFQDEVPKERIATPAQEVATTNAVLKVLAAAGLLLSDKDQGGGKYAVRCPFHPDEGHGMTSTVFYAGSNHFWCFHDRCKHRLNVEFLRAIPGMREIAGNISPEFRLELESAVPEVSVAAARDRILQALTEARPYERTATVVRVTTGAGKTRAVAEYLSAYCAPAEEESIGRSAFLATPTNALLREVKERLTIPHRVATGALAVLNDDGSPSCLKFAKAKQLQESGGDVHRLMCAGCEFKEGCPAIAGSRTGEGSLVLTNHALLPSLVRQAHLDGKLPLVVWDESPPFVEMVRVTEEDLDWYIRRFDEEDQRRGVTLDQLAQVTLFSERFRVAWRPLVEAMRRLGSHDALGAAVAEYAATRLADSHFERAEAMLSLAPSSDPWTRIRAAAQGARRVNVSEQMFDALTDASQADVLRASAVQKFLEKLIEVGEAGASLQKQPGAYELSSVTVHGALWKQFGGVILDATAPVHDLKALRPDAHVEDIAVEDKGSNVRIMVQATGLSRTRLAQRGAARREGEIQNVIEHLAGKQREMKKKLKRDVQTLLVTYKSLIPQLPAIPGVEYAHYGNTRGYDGWFQRGFDVFVTVGDPYSNLESDRQAHQLLGVETDIDEYAASRARAELAQAHGRARAPQAKLADGNRLSLHYGRLVPLGWNKNNTLLEEL